MILETLYIFALFVLAVSILPLCFLAMRSYARSKKGIIEGVSRLDERTLDGLGWGPRDYIGTFDLWAPFRLGWNAWGQAVQKQNVALQRVLFRGLPKGVGVSDETEQSVRRFRLYFCLFVVPTAALILLPAFVRLSHRLSDLSGLPLSVCLILLGIGSALYVFLPAEKFQKWPGVEDQT